MTRVKQYVCNWCKDTADSICKKLCLDFWDPSETLAHMVTNTVEVVSSTNITCISIALLLWVCKEADLSTLSNTLSSYKRSSFRYTFKYFHCVCINLSMMHLCVKYTLVWVVSLLTDISPSAMNVPCTDVRSCCWSVVSCQFHAGRLRYTQPLIERRFFYLTRRRHLLDKLICFYGQK